MPKNRHTKIRIRTQEVTIIRLRETNSTGEPHESTDDRDVHVYASVADDANCALLTEGDQQEAGNDVSDPSLDRGS